MAEYLHFDLRECLVTLDQQLSPLSQPDWTEWEADVLSERIDAYQPIENVFLNFKIQQLHEIRPGEFFIAGGDGKRVMILRAIPSSGEVQLIGQQIPNADAEGSFYCSALNYVPERDLLLSICDQASSKSIGGSQLSIWRQGELSYHFQDSRRAAQDGIYAFQCPHVWSPDARFLYFWGLGDQRLCKLNTASMLVEIEKRFNEIHAMTFINTETLALGQPFGKLLLLDAQTIEMQGTVQLPSPGAYPSALLVYSALKRILLSINPALDQFWDREDEATPVDGAVFAWHFTENENFEKEGQYDLPSRILRRDEQGLPACLHSNAQGTQLACLTWLEDPHLYVFDIGSSTPKVLELPFEHAYDACCGFSHDGEAVYVGRGTSVWKLY